MGYLGVRCLPGAERSRGWYACLELLPGASLSQKLTLTLDPEQWEESELRIWLEKVYSILR